MMQNSNTMLVNSKQQYYHKLSGTMMKEMYLNPDHLNDTCRKVQNHILASTTTTTLTLWISAQKRSTLLLSLDIMLRDTIKKVLMDKIPERWSKEVYRYHFEALNVRRSDDKEYEFSYADLPRLSVNDVEDMYLIQVQDKLHHLPLEFVKDFNNALLIFIRRTVIKNKVEDIQLGVESYQITLNLTKPTMFFEGIDQNIPFTMAATHKGVVYLNQYNIKSLMKLSEVKKFCDGTLVKIQENLIHMLSKNKLGSGNKRLKGRDWTDYDVKSSKDMLKKIDEILRHKEQLKRLEEYVGGRPKTVNLHTFVRPM
ncbi:hypothetical protein Tco_0985185 [Tanacetum coccineum]